MSRIPVERSERNERGTQPSRVRATQQRTRATREKILAAALQAFAEHGFDGATTRDMAARAGVHQGLIAYHFSGKEDLWRAAIERIFSLLRESFATRLQALEDADALTRIRLIVRHFVRFSAAHPELHRLMVQEGKSDGPRMQWLVDRHVRPLFDAARALLSAAQSEGLLPLTPPAHLHYMLLGAAAHFFVMAPEVRRLTGIDPMSAEVIETHADAVVRLLLGAVQTGTTSGARERSSKRGIPTITVKPKRARRRSLNARAQ